MIRSLIRLWWRVWAATVDPDSPQPTPLPTGPVPVATPATALIAEAEAAGAADAGARISDAWSFGVPEDAWSETYDTPYVRSLRSRCQAARDALHVRQRQTEGRIAPLRWRSEVARGRMQDAMERMSELATWEASVEALELATVGARYEGAARREAAPQASETSLPDGEPGSGEPEPSAATERGAEMAAESLMLRVPVGPVPEGFDRVRWEGEAMPLRAGWRGLILGGLVVADLPVQFGVYENLLGQSVSAVMIRWLAVATAAVIVFGPFLAGVSLRTRAGTGADKRIVYTILALAAAWLAAAVTLGLLRGHVMQAEIRRGGAQHPSSVTVVVMFSALLLVVGAMAFMLGQARRHPFQEAYVRQRREHERLDAVAHLTAIRLNPAYRPAEPGQGEPVLDAEEREIIGAYDAAVNAYYAALCRTTGDPAFTEAVQQRRSQGSAA